MDTTLTYWGHIPRWNINTAPTNMEEFNQWSGVTVSDGNLMELSLGYYGLSKIPPELANLTNLQSLDLSYNDLSKIPPELANLTNLQSLDLSGNDLSEIPPELGNLTNLQSLDLRGNDLSKIPPELGNLTNLQLLYLWGNDLSEIPPELGNLTNLQSLDLRDNEIQETKIPPELSGVHVLWSSFGGGSARYDCPPCRHPLVSESGLVSIVLDNNINIPIPYGEERCP